MLVCKEAADCNPKMGNGSLLELSYKRVFEINCWMWIKLINGTNILLIKINRNDRLQCKGMYFNLKCSFGNILKQVKYDVIGYFSLLKLSM